MTDVLKLRAQDQKELPGFDARTIADDSMGKLMFVRRRITIDVPEGLMDLLRDIEELTERAVGLVENLPRVQRNTRYSSADNIVYSPSGVIGQCSCGAVYIEDE